MAEAFIISVAVWLASAPLTGFAVTREYGSRVADDAMALAILMCGGGGAMALLTLLGMAFN